MLDSVCGTGQTTREAACLAATGSALGVDITESMVARARALAAAEGLHNARFEHGDAQVYGFPPEHFDLAISRYATMFFADPVAAFRNIRGALEWSVAVHQALTPYAAWLDVSPGAHDHFSLADQGTVEHTLGAAGFTGPKFSDVCEPV